MPRLWVSPPTDSVHGCPLIQSLVSGEALCRFGRVSRAHAGAPAVTELMSEYTDPLLRYNRKEYRRFASRLLAIGVAGLTLESSERIGLFVVKKDGGARQRLIVEARAERHCQCLYLAGFGNTECVEVPSSAPSAATDCVHRLHSAMATTSFLPCSPPSIGPRRWGDVGRVHDGASVLGCAAHGAHIEPLPKVWEKS